LEHSAVILDSLANAIVAGEPAEDAIIERCALVLGRRWRWLRSFARRYLKTFGATRPRQREAAQFLRDDRSLRRHAGDLSVVQRLLPAPQMGGAGKSPRSLLRAIWRTGSL
jgi:hypothetical protein